MPTKSLDQILMEQAARWPAYPSGNAAMAQQATAEQDTLIRNQQLANPLATGTERAFLMDILQGRIAPQSQPPGPDPNAMNAALQNVQQATDAYMQQPEPPMVNVGQSEGERMVQYLFGHPFNTGVRSAHNLSRANVQAMAAGVDPADINATPPIIYNQPFPQNLTLGESGDMSAEDRRDRDILMANQRDPDELARLVAANGGALNEFEQDRGERRLSYNQRREARQAKVDAIRDRRLEAQRTSRSFRDNGIVPSMLAGFGGGGGGDVGNDLTKQMIQNILFSPDQQRAFAAANAAGVDAEVARGRLDLEREKVEAAKAATTDTRQQYQAYLGTADNPMSYQDWLIQTGQTDNVGQPAGSAPVSPGALGSTEFSPAISRQTRQNFEANAPVDDSGDRTGRVLALLNELETLKNAAPEVILSEARRLMPGITIADIDAAIESDAPASLFKSPDEMIQSGTGGTSALQALFAPFVAPFQQSDEDYAKRKPRIAMANRLKSILGYRPPGPPSPNPDDKPARRPLPSVGIRFRDQTGGL
jgi:hypothetical protein